MGNTFGSELATTDSSWLKEHIREVPDFPQRGVGYKDITPLLQNPEAFHFAMDAIAEHFAGTKIDKVIGVEARGFIAAAPVAYRFGAGFVPARKAGKLPWKIERLEYQLEYGTEFLEIHRDAINPGETVLVVDDVLATGGTSAAAAKLAENLGGSVAGIAVIIELSPLGGRSRLLGYDVQSLVRY